MRELTPAGPDLDDAALIELYNKDHDPQLVRMNFVSSIDGAVNLDGLSGGLGVPADKRVFGILRGLADGILVGAGTLRAENYNAVNLDEVRRSRRVTVGLAPVPRLVVVSGGLNIDPGHRALAGAPVRPIIITHAAADDEQRDRLAEVADVLVHGVDRVDLIAALAALRSDYDLNHLLCEGGPTLFGALHAAGLVDEVCLTITPLVTGPGSGRIIAGPAHAAVEAMTLRHAIMADSALLLRYARAA
jgi:riboflavin biosynthesis pyrimidine reductase